MRKEVPKNKECWVEGCNEEIKEWPLCKKHQRMQDKGHKLKLSSPSSPKEVGKAGA